MDLIDKLLQRRQIIRENVRGASKEYVDLAKECSDNANKRLRQEMPHIKIGNDQYFDLELEKGSPAYKRIVMALSGKPIKDKHGNVLHLKTPQEREKFIELVKGNQMYQKATDTTKRMILGQEAEKKEYESLAAHRPNLTKWEHDMGLHEDSKTNLGGWVRSPEAEEASDTEFLYKHPTQGVIAKWSRGPEWYHMPALPKIDIKKPHPISSHNSIKDAIAHADQLSKKRD